MNAVNPGQKQITNKPADALKRYIISKNHEYNTEGLSESETAAYLSRLDPAVFAQQAHEDKMAGFQSWLAGTSDHNSEMKEYENKPGYRRRRTMRGADIPDGKTGFFPTGWGRKQLTHLPGVRAYLRSNFERADHEDMKLQILAEYGPHDLESAWQYYKGWVLGEETPLGTPEPEGKTGGFRPATDFDDGYYSGPLRPNDSLNMPDFGGREKMPEDHAVVDETIHRLGHEGSGMIENSALFPTIAEVGGGGTTYVTPDESIVQEEPPTPQVAYKSRFERPDGYDDGYDDYVHNPTPNNSDPQTAPTPTPMTAQRSDGSPPPQFLIPPEEATPPAEASRRSEYQLRDRNTTNAPDKYTPTST